MSYVVITFGSTARGDTNSSSDLDIVCIWSNTAPDYQSISRKYGSITFYSVETLLRMKEKGALFLTHLDIDSVYVEGNADLLTIFKNYRPSKLQMEYQLHETARFVQNLRWYPDNSIGLLWLCDSLYVALRNYIYCNNALTNKYLFGFTDALTASSISDLAKSTLMQVREGKYAYRRGVSEAIDIRVKDIDLTCSELLDKPVIFTLGGLTDWNRVWRFDYWDERLIERAILNQEHADEIFLQKMKRHNYNRTGLYSHMQSIVRFHLHNN